MRWLHMFCITLMAAVAVASGAAAQEAASPVAALANQLRTSRDNCFNDSLSAIRASASVSAGVGALRARINDNGGACAPIDLRSSSVADHLTALEVEVVSQFADYKCASSTILPECEGLRGASVRLASLRRLQKADLADLVQAKADSEQRLERAASFDFIPTQSAFGNNPTYGVNLLNLVIKAQNPGAILPWPDTNEAGPYLQAALANQATCPNDNEGRIACLNSMARVIALAPLYRNLLVAYQRVTPGTFTKLIERLQKSNGEWNAYHFGGGVGRTQLPWELLVNNWYYKSHPTPTIGESVRREDPNSLYESDWREAPKSALILVHPSVGMSLKDVEGADSPILGVVELVGISRWGYDPKTYARKGEWGGSIIAGYQKRDDGDDWGYGALLRLPFQSVNLVWMRSELDNGEEEDVVGLTVDLGKLIPKIDAKCLFKLPNCKAQ